MVIQHNIPALNSYNRLGANNKAVASNLKKLSSGYKINSAADNAAGLAISEKMRAQITGLEACQQNAKDGISLVQTAEGALTEVHSMLNRMVELSTLASNGTYSDSNREKYQNEIEELKDEIDRIADSTNFNGIDLLNGNLSGGAMKTSQAQLIGSNVSTFSPAKATAAVAVKDLTVNTKAMASEETYDVDGQALVIDWTKGEAKKVFDKIAVKQDTTTEDGWKSIAEDLTELFNNEMKTQGLSGGVKVSVADFTAGTGAKLSIESLNTGADSRVGFAGTDLSSTNAKKAIGALLFGDSAGNNVSNVVEAGKKFNNTLSANDKMTMTINGTTVDVLFSGSTGAVTATDGSTLNWGDATASTNSGGATVAPNDLERGAVMQDVATQVEDSIQAAVEKYNIAMGYKAGDDEYVDYSKFTVDVDKSGGLKVTYAGDNAEDVTFSFGEKTENGITGTAASLLGLASKESSQGVGGNALSLQIGDTADDYNRINVSIQDCHASALGVAGIDVTTEASAAKGIDKIKDAIDVVSKVRAKLGATQNRLDHTLNNLETTTENLTESESRIRDTDMAQEMMKYTKNNILVQSAQAMLAQANQIPQGVLQLLQ